MTVLTLKNDLKIHIKKKRFPRFFFQKLAVIQFTEELVSVGQTYHVSKYISARHLFFCIYDFQGKMQEELQDSSVVMQEWVIKTLQIKQDKIQLYVLSSETVDFLGKTFLFFK